MSKIMDWWGIVCLVVFCVAFTFCGFMMSESLAAPKPVDPPKTVNWECRSTAQVQVCELTLGDGTRCVVTNRGGVDCEWGGE
jgi:hypothetical protein